LRDWGRKTLRTHEQRLKLLLREAALFEEVFVGQIKVLLSHAALCLACALKHRSVGLLIAKSLLAVACKSGCTRKLLTRQTLCKPSGLRVSLIVQVRQRLLSIQILLGCKLRLIYTTTFVTECVRCG
jgi:hypothetical protein